MKYATTTTVLLSALIATAAAASTTSLPLHEPLTFKTASTILGGGASSSIAGSSGLVPTATITNNHNTAKPKTATGITATGSAATSSASAGSTVGTSNMGTTQSIGGGKVVALVGALAAVVLCGL